jgi:hypothetical protein
MSFKYFLDLAPEEKDIIDSTSLTKFRRQRLKDVELLDMLIAKMVSDTNYHLGTSKDKDAKVGHKTADTSFFGYKTHIAMTLERIITAAKITGGEQHDGKQLPDLIEKSRNAGIEVEEIIGDKAYDERDNLRLAKKQNIRLIAKLNKTYSVTVHSDIHLEHAAFEETEYFKERYKERYKIEAKGISLFTSDLISLLLSIA